MEWDPISLAVKRFGVQQRSSCWNRILKAFANSLDPDETPCGVSSGSKLFAILIVFFGKKSKKMLILEIQQTTF
ncbi:hypothetical protein DPMN_095691 [Dreissena polymorpha]|uniref:Uncharacterized protein n=1 Tax=Dreissena polymorpha TaxID=45954 RepID=A0A9D4R341_DREPO|nr:hypothetical protein DPMN_095691 [Dreissena polymorpha]